MRKEMSKMTRRLSLLLILAISCEGTNIVQYCDKIDHSDARNRTCVGGFATSFALHNDRLVVGYPWSYLCDSSHAKPTGSILIYQMMNNTVKRPATEIFSPPDSKYFGTLVAINSRYIAVGAPINDRISADPLIYVYNFDPPHELVTKVVATAKSISVVPSFYATLNINEDDDSIIVGRDRDWGDGLMCIYKLSEEKSKKEWKLNQIITDNFSQGRSKAVNDNFIASTGINRRNKVSIFRKTLFGNYSFLHTLDPFEGQGPEPEQGRFETHLQLSDDTLRVFVPSGKLEGTLYEYKFDQTSNTFNKTAKLAQVKSDAFENHVAIDDDRLVVAPYYSQYPRIVDVYKLSPSLTLEANLISGDENVRGVSVRKNMVFMKMKRGYYEDYNAAIFFYDMNTAMPSPSPSPSTSPRPSSATCLGSVQSLLVLLVPTAVFVTHHLPIHYV